MDKDLRIGSAVAELIEACDFIMHLTEVSREQTVVEVAARDPSFMEHDKAREDPPSGDLFFWSHFAMWTISRLREKYNDIWEEVTEAYSHTPAAKRLSDKTSLKEAVRQVEEILGGSGFQEE